MTCEFCGCEVCTNLKCGTCGFDFGICSEDPYVDPTCPVCSREENTEDSQTIQPGLLNKIQMDLLSSFLVGHWKEISTSEHRVAFERILETLNPGALKAVKHLQKVM